MAESVRWAGRLGLTLGSGICAGEVALSLGPLFPTLEALGKALVSKGTAESGGRPLGRNGVTVRPERQWCTAVSRRSCAAAVALRDSRSASYSRRNSARDGRCDAVMSMPAASGHVRWRRSQQAKYEAQRAGPAKAAQSRSPSPPIEVGSCASAHAMARLASGLQPSSASAAHAVRRRGVTAKDPLIYGIYFSNT